MASPSGGERQTRPEPSNVEAGAAGSWRLDASLPLRSVRRIRSELLFVQGNELIIEHAGREYRLRLTARGKLILTA